MSNIMQLNVISVVTMATNKQSLFDKNVSKLRLIENEILDKCSSNWHMFACCVLTLMFFVSLLSFSTFTLQFKQLRSYSSV